MNNRKYQANETKCKIINESMKLFEEHSFDEITVDMICRQCGLSKGAFYHHFKTKEELVVKHYVQTLDCKLINEVEPRIGTMPLRELLDLYLDVDIDFFKKLGQEWVIFLQQTVLKSPEYLESRNVQESLEKIISYSVEHGEVTFNRPADFCIRFMYYVLQGFVSRWCIMRGSIEALEELKEYMHQALDACIADE